MKIIAIGRNYAEHIKELANETPDSPVIFTKPETALLRNNEAFYIPTFSNDIHHEIEIVVKISKIGKNIDEKFAHKYYQEIALGVDFTARDVQSELKKKGLPWDLAKGFDGSAPISKFVDKDQYKLPDLNFSLKINGETRQAGTTAHMIYSIDSIISYVSRYFTLKVGDLIFTGTPAGVGRVNAGDKLTAYIQDKCFMDFEVL